MPRLLAALLLPLVAAIALLLALAQAQAQTSIDVTATPNKFQVSATAPTTISVVWRIVRVSPPVPGTASSPAAQDFVGGTPVPTSGAPLSRSYAGSATTEVPFTSATVTIPQAGAVSPRQHGP